MSNSTFDNAVLALSPIRYYPLSDASGADGATILDLGSQARNGIVHGTVLAGQASIIPGDSNTCLKYNGSNSWYIDIPTTGLPSGASAWTMLAVVQFASIPPAGNYPIVLDIGQYHVNNNDIALYFNGDTQQFSCAVRGVTDTGGPTPVANKPYLLAASYDGTYVRFFVNGIQYGGNVPATLAMAYGQAEIGNVLSFFGLPWTGSMQSAAFWSSALSQGQVDNLVQAMVSPIPAKTIPTDGYGIYDYTLTDMSAATYQPRLQQMASGGFKLVMNYSILYGSTANLIAYINYAASLGMKVIVSLKDVWRSSNLSTDFPTIYTEAGSPGITNYNAFATYVVNQVKALAGTWGYYIADEPGAGNHTAVHNLAGYVRAADATRPRLIIENWQSIPGDATYYGQSVWADCCEDLGDDIYPLGAGAGPTVYIVAKGIQDFCTAHGLGSAIVLQAVPNGGAWPSSSDIAGFLADALTFMQPRLVLFYSYFDIQNSADPTTHWNNLVQALQTIQPLHYVSATWKTRDMQAIWKTRG